MADYRVRTLGVVGVERDGEPVDIPVGKPFGLLVLVSVSREPVTRGELAALLWPEAEPERARQSVRQALLAVRQALGEDVFEGEDPLAVDGARVTSDVAELRTALEAGRFEEALELRSGGFLEGVAFSRARPFDAWVEDTRAELDRTLARSLELDAASRSAAGDHEGALRLLDVASSVRPSGVSVQISRVESLLALGSLPEARAALAHLDLTALTDAEAERYQAVRARLRERAAGDPGRAEGPLVPELVGRGEELAVLNALWREASGGELRVADVAGPPGIGKTRLVREFARSLTPLGQVAWVTAYAAEVHAEWSALTALISELLELPGAVGTSPATDRVLLSLVPRRNGAVGDPSTPRPRASEAALADALADLMAAVAYERPLLVVCDDAQWVDAESRRVLTAAIRRLWSEPVMLVLCSRASEPAVKPARPELDPVELWLDPLRTAELAELLLMSRYVADAGTGEELARRVERATGGSPLLVVELLKELERIDALVPDGEELRIEPHRVPGRYWDPETVRGLVAQRINRLSPTAALVSTELARHGRPMPLDALVRATDLGSGAVRQACAEMAEQGIALYDGTTVRFAHDTLLQAARRRPARSSRALRWGALVAAAVVVLFLAALAGLLWFHEAPYGGGILLAETESGWGEVLYGRGDPAGWGLRPLPDTLPDLRYSPMPVRVVDGSIRWYGTRSHGAVGGPDIVRFGPADTVEPVVYGPGDIGAPVLHPDGTLLAYKAEDTTAVDYRDFVMAARPDGSGERRLYAAADLAYPQTWALDGRSLAVVAPGRGDTLLLLSRTGAELGRFTFDAIASTVWCGPRLAVVTISGGRHTLRLLDPRSGDTRTYDGTAIGPLACSPDGTHLVHGSAHRGARTLVLRDLASGATQPLTIDPAIRRLFWVPDAVPPLPVALEATLDSLTLPWGGRAPLDAVVRLSSGETVEPDSLVWESLNPAVAAVAPSGRVVANRPGRAAVVAREAPHLVDTVFVRVDGEPPPAAAVRESFETLDTTRWRIIGQPPPRATRVGPDSLPALAITGDEKWIDGVVLRRPVSASRGLTAELEARIRVTHDTWQDIRLCLTTVHPDSIDRRTGTTRTQGNPAACVRYPGAEGARFDPGELSLGGWPNPGLYIPIEPPGDDWFHLAIQIRPDGRVSAYLNHQFIGAAPVHLTDDVDRPWTVQINGSSVGTEAYVRAFTLWTEARYDR